MFALFYALSVGFVLCFLHLPSAVALSVDNVSCFIHLTCILITKAFTYGDEDLIYNLQAARETRDLHPVMCYKNW